MNELQHNFTRKCHIILKAPSIGGELPTKDNWRTPYPVLNTSANLRNAALIRIGKGNRSTRDGNLTIASHWSPTRADLRPDISRKK